MEPLSVIIACYNGEARLPGLLKDVRSQEYDQSKVEIIVVDDASTDRTVEIAHSFGARVEVNGHRNIERGKAIGLRAASHDYAMFIDDDNRLPHNKWLSGAMDALTSNPDAVGVQAAWFSVLSGDRPTNRYCSIFGIGDPLAMYLRRKDHLASFERRWSLPGEVLLETERYWKIRFNADSFLTIGSQGFIGRSSLIRTTDWFPYLFHVDSNYELMLAGHDRFLILKESVQHDYCTDVASLFSKKRRDLRLYLSQSRMRKFRWQTRPWQFVLAAVQMFTLVQPTAVAVRGFLKTRDPACFLHPLLCVLMPLMYFGEVLNAKAAAIVNASGRNTP